MNLNFFTVILQYFFSFNCRGNSIAFIEVFNFGAVFTYEGRAARRERSTKSVFLWFFVPFFINFGPIFVGPFFNLVSYAPQTACKLDDFTNPLTN